MGYSKIDHKFENTNRDHHPYNPTYGYWESFTSDVAKGPSKCTGFLEGCGVPMQDQMGNSILGSHQGTIKGGVDIGVPLLCCSIF